MYFTLEIYKIQFLFVLVRKVFITKIENHKTNNHLSNELIFYATLKFFYDLNN